MQCSDQQAAEFDRRRKSHARWRAVPAGSRPLFEHVVLHDRPMRTLSGRYARSLDRLRVGLDAPPRIPLDIARFVTCIRDMEGRASGPSNPGETR